MPGTVVQVYFREKKAGWGEFTLLETDFPDFEQFLIAVDENRLICGTNLWTRPQPSGARLVTSRKVVAFRGEEVLRASLPTWRLIEEAEA